MPLADAELSELWRDSLARELDGLDADATYRTGAAPRVGVPTRAEEERFAVGEELGRGGMGTVFRARQSSLERDVALKQLGGAGRHGSTARLRDDFLSEALITGQLEHPNIVPVHDLGLNPDGELFLAMKLVDGESWRALLRREPDALLRHLDILLQVCNAVAFAHSRGIVHNDLKPSNVMLGAFGEVLVLDWGVATRLEEDGRVRAAVDLCTPCGTPAYMAPELAEGRGRDIGPWTDTYLLGAVLYEILSGRPPHSGKKFLQVILSAARGRFPPLPADAPEDLAAICRRALDPDPRARYPSVAALQEELRRFLLHRESLEIVARASLELERCAAQFDRLGSLEAGARDALYASLDTTVAAFAQARSVWPENPRAGRGEAEARRLYADTALRLGDVELASSQVARLEAVGGPPGELRARVDRARVAQRRARRSARRLRWTAAGLLLLLVCALGLGLVVVVGQRAEVVAERDLARQRGAIAQDALEDMTQGVFDTLVDHGSTGTHGLARELLVVARKHLERLAELEREPSSLSLLGARARVRLGDLKLQIEGDLDGADSLYASALTALEALRAELGEQLDFHLSQVRARRGEVVWQRGEVEAARRIFEAELVALGRFSHVNARRQRSLVLERLTEARRDTGDLQGALEAARQSVTLDRKLLAEFPGNRQFKEDLSHSLGMVGELLLELGRFDEVEDDLAAAERLARDLVASGEDIGPQLALAAALLRRSSLDKQREQVDAAAARLDEGLSLLEGVCARDPTHAEARLRIAMNLVERGRVAILQDSLALGSRVFARAEAVCRALPAAARSVHVTTTLAEALLARSRLCRLELDNARARALTREARSLLGGLLARSPGVARAFLYARACLELAFLSLRADPAAARALFLEAEEHLSEGSWRASPAAHLEAAQALLYALPAAPLERQAALADATLALVEGARQQAPDHPQYVLVLVSMLNDIGNQAFAEGALERAEALYREGLEGTEELAARQVDYRSHRLFDAILRVNLGNIAAERGAVDEARAWYAEGLARWPAPHTPTGSLDFAEALRNCAALALDQGTLEEAAALLERARALLLPLLPRLAESPRLRRVSRRVLANWLDTRFDLDDPQVADHARELWELARPDLERGNLELAGLARAALEVLAARLETAAGLEAVDREHRRLLGVLAGQPRAPERAELEAFALHNLGRSAGRRGEVEAAARLLREAVEAQQRGDLGRPAARLELAAYRTSHGFAELLCGRAGPGAAALVGADSLLTALEGSAEPAEHASVALRHTYCAAFAGLLGAEEATRRMLELAARLEVSTPQADDAVEGMARLLDAAGRERYGADDLPGARLAFGRAVALWRLLHRWDAGPEVGAELGLVVGKLGAVALEKGEFAEAAAHAAEAVELLSASADPEALFYRARMLQQQLIALCGAERFDEAREVLARFEALGEGLAAEDPAQADWHAQALRDLAGLVE